MARIFRVTMDLYPLTDPDGGYCIETFETVRTAKPNRVLHFGVKAPLDPEEVDFILECLHSELVSLVNRTVGAQHKLEFS